MEGRDILMLVKSEWTPTIWSVCTDINVPSKF